MLTDVELWVEARSAGVPVYDQGNRCTHGKRLTKFFSAAVPSISFSALTSLAAEGNSVTQRRSENRPQSSYLRPVWCAGRRRALTEAHRAGAFIRRERRCCARCKATLDGGRAGFENAVRAHECILSYQSAYDNFSIDPGPCRPASGSCSVKRQKQ